jgi:probable rRNA maturation factor
VGSPPAGCGLLTAAPAVTLVVVVATEGVRVPLSAARVRALANAVLRKERVREALVSIAFVSRRTIARLNRTHLGHPGATDVISFAFRPPSPRPSSRNGPGLVGDIYIAPDVARLNALRMGVRQREEVARLVVHGLLHVVGHDHPEGVGRTESPMWRRQEQLLRVVGA